MITARPSPPAVAASASIRSRARTDLLIATAAANLLGLALPLALLWVYDRILPAAAAVTLPLLLLLAGGAVLAELLLSLLRVRVGAWAAARQEHQAACAGMAQLLQANLGRFDRHGLTHHLERLRALTLLRDLRGVRPALVLADLPFAALFLALVAVIGGPLAWWPALAILILSAVVWWLRRRLAAAVAADGAQDGRRRSFLLEALRGIGTIKALGMERLMLRSYERLNENCARAEHRVEMLGVEAASLAATAAQLTTIAIVVSGSIRVMDGGLSLGALAACALLASRAMQPVQDALAVWAGLQAQETAERRADDLSVLPPDRDPALPAMPRGPGSVSFRGVGFRYALDAPLVLSEIDLDIAPGSVVGLVGQPGSGKTTLLWLMMGLLAPSDGRVYLNGRNPRRFHADSLRTNVAYLGPEAALFDGTILENITMFRDARRTDALRAAEQVDLAGLTGRLPHGLDTRIAPHAADTLPRGLARRLALARALVDEPGLLLLDGAVGVAEERAIERLRGDRTIVLTAREPALLPRVDHLWMLGGGRLSAMAGRE